MKDLTTRIRELVSAKAKLRIGEHEFLLGLEELLRQDDLDKCTTGWREEIPGDERAVEIIKALHQVAHVAGILQNVYWNSKTGFCGPHPGPHTDDKTVIAIWEQMRAATGQLTSPGSRLAWNLMHEAQTLINRAKDLKCETANNTTDAKSSTT